MSKKSIEVPKINTDDLKNSSNRSSNTLLGMLGLSLFSLFPGKAAAQESHEPDNASGRGVVARTLEAPDIPANIKYRTEPQRDWREFLKSKLPAVPRLETAPFTQLQKISLSKQEHQGTTKRTPFGIGWLSDSLFTGVTIALDAMALMYARSRRLVRGDEATRREEKDLRKKIGILHAVVPVPLFIAGYFASDILIGGGTVIAQAAVATLYAASGAVMYAFSNNVLREASGNEQNEDTKGFVEQIERTVDRFGKWMINRMPSAAWATAMGVTVDAVISGLKYVQSSGWGKVEVLASCMLAGAVVYGLISFAQQRGESRLRQLIKQGLADPKKNVERISCILSRFGAGGFIAFRYFAWCGFINSALTTLGASVNEWLLRGVILGVALLQGKQALSEALPRIRAKDRNEAKVYLGLIK